MEHEDDVQAASRKQPDGSDQTALQIVVVVSGLVLLVIVYMIVRRHNISDLNCSDQH
jgi:hypothetical protein